MAVNHSVDLTPSDRMLILELLDRYLPDTTVWTFGSRAKLTSNAKSDLDLVAFANENQKHQVFLLQEEFEESDLPFRIDLLIWDELSTDFQDEIRSSYVILKDCLAKVQI